MDANSDKSKGNISHLENAESPSNLDSAQYEPKPNYVVGICLTIMLTCGGFLFGYDTGTISGFLGMKGFITSFGVADELGEFHLPSSRAGLLVSIFSIGALIGALSSSKAAESYGRIKTIAVYNVVYCLAVIVQLSATFHWVQILVGRFISGCGIGGFCVVIPMLISESVPSDLRGASISAFQLMVTFGIFIGNILCYGFRESTNAMGYKIPLGISLVFSAILFIGLYVTPESSRYLLSINKNAEACNALAETMRMDPLSNYVINEIELMAASVIADRNAGNGDWFELLHGKPRLFYRVCIGLTILATQQLCGPNYFFYYGTSLFSKIGSSNSFANAMILSGVNFACTFAGIYFVAKFNRRTVLMGGSFVMLIAFVVFASLGSFALEDSNGVVNTVVGKIMITFACIFIFGFASTWAPVAFVVIAEIFPQRIRSKAMSLANCSLWTWNFLISFFTPMITAKIGYLYGYVFCGAIFFSLFFVYFGIPETKGLTLEEIDELYASNISAKESSIHVSKILDGKQVLVEA